MIPAAESSGVPRSPRPALDRQEWFQRWVARERDARSNSFALATKLQSAYEGGVADSSASAFIGCSWLTRARTQNDFEVLATTTNDMPATSSLRWICGGRARGICDSIAARVAPDRASFSPLASSSASTDWMTKSDAGTGTSSGATEGRCEGLFASAFGAC